VTKPPKINCSGVSVVSNKHVVLNFDGRKFVVVEGTVFQEVRGADGKKRDVEGPDILERWFYRKELFGTNKLIGEVGASVEGEKTLSQGPNAFPKVRGKDEKESDVRKKRDDEDVHEKSTRRKGESGEEEFVVPEP